MVEFYRKKSAIQIKTIAPKYNEKGYFERTGCLFMEGANGENKQYDWSKKIKFAIGINDLNAIYAGFYNFDRSEQGILDIELLHDENAGTDKAPVVKKLTLKTTQNNQGNNVYYMTLIQGNEKVSVVMGIGDLIKFKLLCEQGLGFMIGLK